MTIINKNEFVKGLQKHADRIYSQTIEDGIIREVFNNIGVTNKYFIEFGAWDGTYLSNTGNLRINHRWNGLLLEGNLEKSKQYNYVTHAMVTAENINEIFEKGGVPRIYDLLSIDIDGNDFWVWKAIDELKYRARVVIIEYNSNFYDLSKSVAIKYAPNLNSMIPSINYYGATVRAFKKLGEEKGYSLIFRINDHNLIFVDRNLLHPNDANIEVSKFLNENGRAEGGIAGFNNLIENRYNYNTKLLRDVFMYTNKFWHWNEYADTTINVTWEQDFTKEWIEI